MRTAKQSNKDNWRVGSPYNVLMPLPMPYRSSAATEWGSKQIVQVFWKAHIFGETHLSVDHKVKC